MEVNYCTSTSTCALIPIYDLVCEKDAKNKVVEDVVVLSGDHLYRMDYMDFVQVTHRLSSLRPGFFYRAHQGALIWLSTLMAGFQNAGH